LAKWFQVNASDGNAATTKPTTALYDFRLTTTGKRRQRPTTAFSYFRVFILGISISADTFPDLI
jgi:hypothetical protein